MATVTASCFLTQRLSRSKLLGRRHVVLEAPVSSDTVTYSSVIKSLLEKGLLARIFLPESKSCLRCAWVVVQCHLFRGSNL